MCRRSEVSPGKAGTRMGYYPDPLMALDQLIRSPHCFFKAVSDHHFRWKDSSRKMCGTRCCPCRIFWAQLAHGHHLWWSSPLSQWSNTDLPVARLEPLWLLRLVRWGDCPLTAMAGCGSDEEHGSYLLSFRLDPSRSVRTQPSCLRMMTNAT